MNAKGLTIAVYLTLTSCAITSGPPGEPVPLPPEGGPAGGPPSEAKDLVSEVVRDKDRLMVVQRPKQLLTRSDAACVPSQKMRVWWDSLYVCRTPDDPGSSEEWDVTYYAGIINGPGTTWRASFSPPDQLDQSTAPENILACWKYTANRTTYLRVPADNEPIAHQMFGVETDFVGNDKLPSIIRIQYMDLANCEGNYLVMLDCGASQDDKRYSCIRTEFGFYTPPCQRNCQNKRAGAPDGCGGTCRECEEPSPACLPCNTCDGKCCEKAPSCLGEGTRCNECRPTGSLCN